MSSILRWLACAALALFATAAVADGKAFTLPQKAKVEMADQRALISFDGKQETLVIDTQIKPVEAGGASAGKQSYAWVVPLPNVPTKVEAGTVGMFDTLRELTRPEMVNRTEMVGWDLWVILIFVAACALAVWLMVPGWWRWIFSSFVVVALLLGILVPVLGVAKKSGSLGEVTLHRHETIGSYDTVVLSSPDGTALAEWLEKNGYPMPVDTAPVVAKLAKEGWCFVAMRLNETSGGFAHPHPMGFVFPAKQAIYPMRLTGAGQVTPLSVELFVCGEQQATAEGFRAGCAVGTTQEGPAERASAMPWGSWIEGVEPVPMVHPGLRRFASEARVLTWLRGTVPAEAMGQDIGIGWQVLTPHRDRFYSDEVIERLTNRAFNGFFFPVLAVAVLGVGVAMRCKRKRLALGFLAAGVGLAWGSGSVATWRISRQLPRTMTEKNEGGKLVAMGIRETVAAVPKALDRMRAKMAKNQLPSAEWIRSALQEGMTSDGLDGAWVAGSWRDYFIEGDSPNQFLIREENGSAKVYFYNGVGQEFQIWPEVPEKK